MAEASRPRPKQLPKVVNFTPRPSAVVLLIHGVRGGAPRDRSARAGHGVEQLSALAVPPMFPSAFTSSMLVILLNPIMPSPTHPALRIRRWLRTHARSPHCAERTATAPSRIWLNHRFQFKVLFLLSLSLFFSLLLDEANPLVKVYDLRFPSPTALPLSMQTSSLVVTSVSPTCFPLVGRA